MGGHSRQIPQFGTLKIIRFHKGFATVHRYVDLHIFTHAVAGPDNIRIGEANLDIDKIGKPPVTGDRSKRPASSEITGSVNTHGRNGIDEIGFGIGTG